ncbi:MAG: AzlD domain-containing protein [Sulfuritalea sp.]|jgi:branched-subunit amino acid transport protein|nr:AzlD domain-containing protein [Sulfuritalea sp.]MBK9349383.1 AzlD domain-containing protein [Sulfuritalea sp.]
MSIWPLMIVCGLITFAIRYSFIAAEGHFQPPDWFVRLLPFVPVAALTALTAPELLLVDGGIELGGGNVRLWAGAMAILAAALWRNTVLTIGIGFLAFHLLQRL